MNRFVKVLLRMVVLGLGSAGIWLNGAAAVAADGKELATLTGHKYGVSCVTFSPDGKLLASAGSTNNTDTIMLWDVATGKQRATFSGHQFGTVSVAFSPDGKILASGGYNVYENTVKLWDVATGKIIATFTGHTDFVTSVAFSPDGKTVASATGRPSGTKDAKPGEVKLWGVATGKELFNFKGHTAQVFCVAFSPDGKTLASASYDKTVKLWDPATGKELATLDHKAPRRWVAYSPDGKTLASLGYDDTITLWDAATRKELAGYKTRGQLLSIAFSPDGKMLASGSRDKTIKLWDAATGKELATLRGHSNWVNSVAFSPDGKKLASASSDKTIKLWEISGGPGASGGDGADPVPDIKKNGAFAFPQAQATVLCDEKELRLSVWNDAKYLYVQAVLWEDGMDGVLREGSKALWGRSVLRVDVDADRKTTPNVDRDYSLQPNYSQHGLWYQVIVQAQPLLLTTLKSDSKGRGATRYLDVGKDQRVRVDCYAISLEELGKKPGDKLRFAYWAQCPKPELTLNSIGFKSTEAEYRQYHLPLRMFHEITLADRPASLDLTQVPDGHADKAADARGDKPPMVKDARQAQRRGHGSRSIGDGLDQLEKGPDAGGPGGQGGAGGVLVLPARPEH